MCCRPRVLLFFPFISHRRERGRGWRGSLDQALTPSSPTFRFRARLNLQAAAYTARHSTGSSRPTADNREEIDGESTCPIWWWPRWRQPEWRCWESRLDGDGPIGGFPVTVAGSYSRCVDTHHLPGCIPHDLFTTYTRYQKTARI